MADVVLIVELIDALNCYISNYDAASAYKYDINILIIGNCHIPTKIIY